MNLALHREAPELVSMEIARAWRRYLRETREAEPDEYAAVEERAWQRLASNLAALGTSVEPPVRRPD